MVSNGRNIFYINGFAMLRDLNFNEKKPNNGEKFPCRKKAKMGQARPKAHKTASRIFCF